MKSTEYMRKRTGLRAQWRYLNFRDNRIIEQMNMRFRSLKDPDFICSNIHMFNAMFKCINVQMSIFANPLCSKVDDLRVPLWYKINNKNVTRETQTEAKPSSPKANEKRETNPDNLPAP